MCYINGLCLWLDGWVVSNAVMYPLAVRGIAARSMQKCYYASKGVGLAATGELLVVFRQLHCSMCCIHVCEVAPCCLVINGTEDCSRTYSITNLLPSATVVVVETSNRRETKVSELNTKESLHNYNTDLTESSRRIARPCLLKGANTHNLLMPTDAGSGCSLQTMRVRKYITK